LGELVLGETCTLGELALGKLDWANLHWAKDHGIMVQLLVFVLDS